jgi:hypothetical protein
MYGPRRVRIFSDFPPLNPDIFVPQYSDVILCSILNDHDINVALLQICGGIAGSIEQCQGTPTTTSGASGDARFNLQVETTGATIIITKGRWEGCVRAARAVCGNSPFSSTCIGGANDNKNNVLFQLVQQ